uniref:Chemokine interleukin-8-like domain-containing protein n=1 Tax=Xenopus tropicalis TaxID=8364 RepID=A0A6I8SXT0_XENTR
NPHHSWPISNSFRSMLLAHLGNHAECTSGDYDCCTSYTQKKIPQKIIKGFYIQRSSEVCDIDAISKLCADPKQKWVESRIEELK